MTSSGTQDATYTYDPYGNTSASGTESGANPFRYQTGYQDLTGEYHYGARYSNPGLAAWTQLGPSGKTSGYTYAADDPINSSDPTGSDLFSSIDDAFEIIAEPALSAISFSGYLIGTAITSEAIVGAAEVGLVAFGALTLGAGLAIAEIGVYAIASTKVATIPRPPPATTTTEPVITTLAWGPELGWSLWAELWIRVCRFGSD